MGLLEFKCKYISGQSRAYIKGAGDNEVISPETV